MTTAGSGGGGGTAARRIAREQAARSKDGGRSSGGRTSGDTSPSSSTAPETPSTPTPGAITRSVADPDALAALEEERDFLLRSLEDLEREHDAGDVDDADYTALKDDYTARAAHAIRAIERRNVTAAAARSPHDWRRTVGVLVIVGVLAAGTGWLVFRNAGTRAPGQGLTGDTRQDSANLIQQAQGLTGQASTALSNGNTAKAMSLYQSAVDTYTRALDLSPQNVQAMTYRAWVQHSMALQSSGDAAARFDAESLKGLTEAIATDPTYADARVFRAILERNLQMWTAAKADLDAVDASKLPQMFTSMVDAVRRDVAAGLAGATTTTTTVR